MAHYVAEDHVGPGLAGFAFAAFAVSWAWLNYTWFASAYDTVVSVALPLALYVSVYYGLYSALMRTSDRFHLGLLAGTGAVLVLSLALAATGTSMAVCLVVLAFAPAVTVVGYEVLGYRHMADAIERL